MHHYINFVRKNRVVCVVPLPRHPTPPPSWRRAIGSAPPQNTLLSGKVTCCPDVSFGYGAAHRQTNAAAPHILYIIRIYTHPPPLLGCLGAPSHLSYVLRTADNIYILLWRIDDAFISIPTRHPREGVPVTVPDRNTVAPYLPWTPSTMPRGFTHKIRYLIITLRIICCFYISKLRAGA